MSKWVNNVLQASGIDISLFTAHSIRHAATSKAYSVGVSLDVIRRIAGWSSNSTLFAKYCNRIISDDISDQGDFVTSVLKGYN